MSLALLAVRLLLLLLVLIPGLGATVNGARRWMRIGPINFQVSELAKVLVLTWVCSYCVRKRAELEDTCRASRKPVGLLAVAALLLLLEPDFGAATVLFATGFAVLFVAGARLRYVLLLVSAAALAFAVLALTSAYRLKRLTGFLHPWDDPFNGGFQLTQSLIAIGRGSWFGVGLGSSVQKLFYLPEAHTDFVFAVLAEELGLVGVIGVLALVRRAGVARLSNFAHGGAGGHAVSILRRARVRRVARPAGHREHRRQHGGVADQGLDAAAAQLRPQQLAGELGVDRCAAADLSRGQMHLALRCDAHAGRRAMSGARPREAPCSSWRAVPAGTCSRRSRWRRCCASAGSPWYGSACPPAWSRAWCRPTAFRSSGCASRAFAARASRPGRSRRCASSARVLQSLRILRRVRPRAVLGAGGYVSGPGGIAAWLLRIPLLIHEQNAIAGLTNRWLSRFATQVLEAFPGSFAPAPTPAPSAIRCAPTSPRSPEPAVRFAGREPRARLLVFGGSQGAQRLNAVVPQALARLDPARRPQVRHQAGERGLEAARAAYLRRSRSRPRCCRSSKTWPRRMPGRISPCAGPAP